MICKRCGKRLTKEDEWMSDNRTINKEYCMPCWRVIADKALKELEEKKGKAN